MVTCAVVYSLSVCLSPFLSLVSRVRHRDESFPGMGAIPFQDGVGETRPSDFVSKRTDPSSSLSTLLPNPRRVVRRRLRGEDAMAVTSWSDRTSGARSFSLYYCFCYYVKARCAKLSGCTTTFCRELSHFRSHSLSSSLSLLLLSLLLLFWPSWVPLFSISSSSSSEELLSPTVMTASLSSSS